MAEAHYHYLIVGGLREDYCITHDGRVTEGAQGGNAAYAGAGAALWNRSVGLLSRVGCNYPSQWLDQLERIGFDVSGVVVLPEPQDTRTFYAYLSPVDRVDTNPAFHFQRIGRPLPKALLDYRTSTEGRSGPIVWLRWRCVRRICRPDWRGYRVRTLLRPTSSPTASFQSTCAGPVCPW
jgi:hypothetical protein